MQSHLAHAARSAARLVSLASIGCVALLGSAVGSPAPAQAPAGTTAGARIPVTVAVVDGPFRGSDVTVVRRRARGRPDVIVVSRDATAPGRVAAAAAALLATMDQEGDDARTQGLLRVPTDAAAPPAEVAAAARAIRKALATPAVDVPGVGAAHALTVYVPDARLRAYLAARRRAGRGAAGNG